MTLDPAVAEQLTQLTLTGAQQGQLLTGALDRNLVANASAVLTLGVQQINMASLNLQTSIDPMEGAAAANLRASQDPSTFAGLNTAAGIPRSGVADKA
jgi:hypothetical protein